MRGRYAPLQPFEHIEHGKDADPSFKTLFAGNAKVTDLTASTGTEVDGVQLTDLTEKGKGELALFVAERKVVGSSAPTILPTGVLITNFKKSVFHNQNFASIPIPAALEYASYFGRLHVHPTSGAPVGHPEVHLVHRGAEDTTANHLLEKRTNSITWHSDVTYEAQPPGTTFLYLLDGPKAGGDTLFSNQVEAYNRFSEGFKERLHGLKALHSGQLDAF